VPGFEVTHVPFVHVPVQVRPQPPQLALLLLVSTQELPHRVWPPLQPQVPLLHAVAPVGQALQPPQ
jgi:hypothetical protein